MIYWTIIEANVTIRNRITMSAIIALETQLDSLESAPTLVMHASSDGVIDLPVAQHLCYVTHPTDVLHICSRNTIIIYSC